MFQVKVISFKKLPTDAQIEQEIHAWIRELGKPMQSMQVSSISSKQLIITYKLGSLI